MISKIRENLYLSAADDVIESELKSRKIDTVLNVSLETSTGSFSGVDFIKLGFRDDPSDLDNAKPAIRRLQDMLNNSKTVLVHCRAGASRSPHVVVSALAVIENREYDDVFNEVCGLRSRVIRPSLQQLKIETDNDFYATLKKKLGR